MTLRERIADWISGGALSEARSRADNLARDLREKSFRLRFIGNATMLWNEFGHRKDVIQQIGAIARGEA